MRKHAKSGCKAVARRLWNSTWKRWTLGAGGGATTWKVIEQVVAMHTTTPEQRALAWGGLATALFAVTAVSKYGNDLLEAGDAATDVAAEAAESVADDIDGQ